MNKDGGAAFPRNGEQGMSLRDYFAGQALMGAMIADIELAKAGKKIFDKADEELADTCYKIADAMLKAREVTDE